MLVVRVLGSSMCCLASSVCRYKTRCGGPFRHRCIASFELIIQWWERQGLVDS